MEDSAQITLGLKVYSNKSGENTSKTPEQVLREISVARDRGSKGVILFDLEHASDDVLEALAAGPFSVPSIEPP
jgi:hypothetical protein